MGGVVWLKAEGAIHLKGSSGLASGNFENWNLERAVSCDLVIKF